jgi:Fe-S oxidoreductase
MDDASLFRFPPTYQVIPLKTSLDWSSWDVQNNPVTEETTAPGSGGDPAGGFAKAVEMCNNNGHCRKFDAGTMCPSYRVTRDEKHLTRGRANTLRLALSNQLGQEALFSDEVKEVFDLCVSCKGCKRECPTGVDMAKMKIEYLSHYKKKHGWTLRDQLIAALPRYAHTIAAIPGLAFLFNLRNHVAPLAYLGEKLTGISAKRSLPTWRRDTVWRSQLGCTEEALLASSKPVVLWADTFNGCFETENIQAAVRVLEASGYSVHIPRKANGHYCCGRTYLASGMVDRAKESIAELLTTFTRFTDKNIPIIGLEPSCILTLRDELLVMNFGPSAQKLAAGSQTFEEFLVSEAQAGRFIPKLKSCEKQILLHGHCHQKSFDAVKPIITLLKMIPNAQPQLIETSCCGMAGSFGYESEHHAVSLQMAELQLLPAIRQAPDAIVLADGSSCRHQIKDGAKREALHVARILEMHLQ